MKQKVLLAVAIIHDPEVIFFDEPTAGLDPRAALTVKQLVKDLSSQGKTLLISSHRLPVVEELCDRIGIINNGQLIAIGTIILYIEIVFSTLNKFGIFEKFLIFGLEGYNIISLILINLPILLYTIAFIIVILRRRI